MTEAQKDARQYMMMLIKGKDVREYFGEGWDEIMMIVEKAHLKGQESLLERARKLSSLCVGCSQFQTLIIRIETLEQLFK